MYSDVCGAPPQSASCSCPEELTVHDDRLEHLGHHRPLATAEDVLLLLGQGHLVRLIGVVLLQAGIGARASQIVRDGVALKVDAELVALDVVTATRDRLACQYLSGSS